MQRNFNARLNPSPQDLNTSVTFSNIKNNNKTETTPKFYYQQSQESERPISKSQGLYYLDGNMLHNASQEAIFPQGRFQNSSVTKLMANLQLYNNSYSNIAGMSQQAAGTNRTSAQEIPSSKLRKPENWSNGLPASNISRQEANSNYLNTNRSQPESNTSLLDSYIFNLADRSIDNKIFSTPQELSMMENSQSQTDTLSRSNQKLNSQRKPANTPKVESSQSSSKKVSSKIETKSPNRSLNFGFSRNKPKNTQPVAVEPKNKDNTNLVQDSSSFMPNNMNVDNQARPFIQDQQDSLKLDALIDLSPNSAVAILMGGIKRSQRVQPVRSSTPEILRSTNEDQGWVIKPKNTNDMLELQAIASKQPVNRTLHHLFDNRYLADKQARLVNNKDTLFNQHTDREFRKLTSQPIRAYENHLLNNILDQGYQKDATVTEDFQTFTNENAQYSNAKSPNTQMQRAKASGMIYFGTDTLLSTEIHTQNESRVSDRRFRFVSSLESPETTMPSMQDLPSTRSRSFIDSKIHSETLLEFFREGNLLNKSTQATPRDSRMEPRTPKKSSSSSTIPEPKDMGGFFNKTGVFPTSKLLEEDDDKDLFFYRKPIRKEFSAVVNPEKPVYSILSTRADGEEYIETSPVINRSGRQTRATKNVPKNEVRVESGTPEKFRYFEKDIELHDYDYQIQRLKEKQNKLRSQEIKPSKDTSLKSMLEYFDKWRETKIF